MSGERIRRPPAQRTDPIRNFWTLFTPPSANTATASGGDPIARGVEAGYRVLTDYLQRGQEAARTMSPFGVPPLAGNSSPRHLPPLMRLAAETADAWMDAVGLTASAPGAAPPPPAGVGPFTSNEARSPVAAAEAPPAATPRPTPGPAALSYSVTIAGTPRVTISLFLRPHAASGELRVLALHADPQAGRENPPALEGAELICHADEERVEVRLPSLAAVPPACYRGMIVAARTSVTSGTLTVDIATAEG